MRVAFTHKSPRLCAVHKCTITHHILLNLHGIFLILVPPHAPNTWVYCCIVADAVWALQVAEWANDADPRWAYLWDCTQDTAVFELVRHLLAPTPELRLKDFSMTPFMQQPTQLLSWAGLSDVAPPLAPRWPQEALSEAGLIWGHQIALSPVPGMPTVLWDPYNIMFSTITGSVHRYA